MKRFAALLILTVLLLIISNIYLSAQEKREPYHINQKIGDTLDLKERDTYKLFLSIQGYQYACFYLNDNQKLDAHITYNDNGNLKDTMLINYTSTNSLAEHINNMAMLIREPEIISPDANRGRGFLLPTADVPLVNHGYIENYDLCFFSGAVGISDRIMMHGGLLVISGSPGQIFNLGFKGNLYNDTGTVSLAAGSQILSIGEADYIPGLCYGVVTLGNSSNKFNILCGGAFSLNNASQIPSSLLIGVGGEAQISGKIKLMAEFCYCHAWDKNPLIIGFRYVNEYISADFGYCILIKNKSKAKVWGSFSFPILSISYSM
jgi:hypothetical protein